MFARILAGSLMAAHLLSPARALAGDGVDAPEFPPLPAVDLAAVPAAATGTGQPQGDTPHPVVARLLSRHGSVAPGARVQLGVHLAQQEAWHTYWKSPGDIGLPTQIRWRLPDGAEAAPHVFPVPARFVADGLVSYGYDDQVLHIAEITLPPELPAGTVKIGADVEWLVCKTSCIPGATSLELELPVADAATDGPHAPLFDATMARWPATDVPELTVTASLAAPAVAPNQSFTARFEVAPAEGVALAPVPEGSWPTFIPVVGLDWMVDAVTVRADAGGPVLIEVKGTTFEPDPLPASDRVAGLLQLQTADGRWLRTEIGVDLPWSAVAAAEPPAAVEAPPPSAGGPSAGVPDAPAVAAAASPPAVVAMNLLLALVGGLILNVMPCVLPVLTLKLYGLVEQADATPAARRQAGVAYTGGILVSFWALAGAVWVARAMFGADVGWGFQMASPTYVAALATAVFLFGLSLFGVYEIPAFGAESAGELGARDGLAGHFYGGVFATLVATPCSAPFLGTAIAFAFQASTLMLVAVFTMVGLGLALPFLLVSFVPGAVRFLPRPGAWMETFKQVLGFTLVGTTIWLVDVLAALVGSDAAIGYLAFLAFASAGAWVYGHFGGVAAEGWRQAASAGAGLLVALLGGWWFLDLELAPPEACADEPLETAELDFDEHIPWQAFSDARIEALAGRTVFVDFTADWCVSCKVNERTVLETSAVRQAMDRLDVVPLVGDWTRQDPALTAWLKRFNRAGVPLYLVVPPSGAAEAVALPEVITPGMVIEALEAAAGKGG